MIPILIVALVGWLFALGLIVGWVKIARRLPRVLEQRAALFSRSFEPEDKSAESAYRDAAELVRLQMFGGRGPAREIKRAA